MTFIPEDDDTEFLEPDLSYGEFLSQQDHGEDEAQPNHIKTLDSSPYTTDVLPSINDMRIVSRKNGPFELTEDKKKEISTDQLVFIGSGLEADVYLYQIEIEGELVPRVLKVFKDPVVQNGKPLGDESADFDITVQALVAATNARWAQHISNPEAITGSINSRDDYYQFEYGGFGNNYNSFKEAAAGVEKINTPEKIQSFVNWVSWYIQQQTINNGKGKSKKQVPRYPYFQPRYNKQGVVEYSPWDLYITPNLKTLSEELQKQLQPGSNSYRGGLAKFTNDLLSITNNVFADPAFQKEDTKESPNPYCLNLPKKIFPDYIMFGILPENHRHALLKGRMYAVMEYVPTILEDQIEKTQKTFSDEIQASLLGQDRALSNRELTKQIAKHFPMEDINNYYFLATMLHSLGLALGDINLGNLGKTEEGSLFLDPSGIGLIGKPQDVATDKFSRDKNGEIIYILPEQDIRQLENPETYGELILSGQRDLFIIKRLYEILLNIMYNEADSLQQGLASFDMQETKEIRDEEKMLRQSKRAQKRRK
jgi:hypothetical protein